MKKFLSYLPFQIIFFVILQSSTGAQSLGFGCLGLVGGFGGYSVQKYSAAGFNEYIRVFNDIRQDSLASPMGRFGEARGFRFGVNFFRADLEGLILTAKGFYQVLSEKNDATVNYSSDKGTSSFELELKTWGVGVDLGTSITKFFSWKVLDAALLFNSASLTSTVNAPGVPTVIAGLKNSTSTLGYSIGTGFILNIIGNYISLEGLAAFTVFSIERMKYDDGTELTVNENSSEIMKNFIESGGFNAVIQLNLGFPL